MNLLIDTRTDAGKRSFYQRLSELPPGRYSVRIDQYAKRRSTDQNARYWMILTFISDQVLDENGKQYSPETWHNFFKAKFLGKDTMIVDGDLILVEKTSTKLTVMEFMDYMMQIEAWSVEHGVHFFDDLGVA